MQSLTRRAFTQMLAAGFLIIEDRLIPSVQDDGSILRSGYRNGYYIEELIKINNQSKAVEKYEYKVTNRYETPLSAERLLTASGAEYEVKTAFQDQGLGGQALITKFAEVRSDFHLLVNDQLFLNQNAAQKQVNTGEVLTIRAILLPAKLEATPPFRSTTNRTIRNIG